MQASCLRYLIRQQHPKATGYGYEARLRGFIEPGFVNVAEGFSPTANDVDVALQFNDLTQSRKAHGAGFNGKSTICNLKSSGGNQFGDEA